MTVAEAISQIEGMKDYLDFLERTQKKHPEYTIWQLHQNFISREVARYYGLTEKEIKLLDEVL